MTADRDERLKAIEERLDMLERIVTSAHNKIAALDAYTIKMDDSYIGMMKKIFKKYGILKSFCEHSGPLLLECHKLLFPERSLDAAKRLAFVFEGNDDSVN